MEAADKYVPKEHKPAGRKDFFLARLIHFPGMILLSSIVPLLTLVAPWVLSFFVRRTQSMALKYVKQRKSYISILTLLFHLTGFIFLATALTTFLFPTLLPSNIINLPNILRSIAVLVSLSSTGLFVWAYLVLGVVPGGDIYPTFRNGQELVTRDLPYSKVRHPMATARLLICISVPLVFGSIWTFVAALAHFVVTLLLTFEEENALRTHFTKTYVGWTKTSGILWPPKLIKILLS